MDFIIKKSKYRWDAEKSTQNALKNALKLQIFSTGLSAPQVNILKFKNIFSRSGYSKNLPYLTLKNLQKVSISLKNFRLRRINEK